MKATITKIARYDKDKSGKPYTNSRGPYKKILLRTQETGEKTLSGFESAVTEGWNVGSQVDIEIDEVTANGNTYYNFKTPRQADVLEKRVASLEAEMVQVKKDLAALKSAPVEDFPTQDTGINPDDIPF